MQSSFMQFNFMQFNFMQFNGTQCNFMRFKVIHLRLVATSAATTQKWRNVSANITTFDLVTIMENQILMNVFAMIAFSNNNCNNKFRVGGIDRQLLPHLS